MPPEAVTQTHLPTNAITGDPRHPRALRVVAVADDALMAEALAALLERSRRVEALRATSPWEVRAVLSRTRANAVLWEAWHADREVLAEIDAVRQQFSVPVCLLTKSVDVEALRELYASCADGLAVLLRRRELGCSDLLRMILQLVMGRVVLSPVLLEQLVRDTPSTRDDALRRLTSPELAVLELVAMGLRNPEIARRLERSQKLVEKHISRIFAKLGLAAGDDVRDRRVTAVRLFLLATSAPVARPGLELAPAQAPPPTLGRTAGASA